MKKVLFLVNPIAGLGGPLGYKGSDGLPILELGILKGPSVAKAYQYARALSLTLKEKKMNMKILSPQGFMGSFILEQASLKYEIICTPRYPSTEEDTIFCLERGLETEPELVIVAGGDGTLYIAGKTIGARKPLLGVPSGTKMYSSVFARTPRDAALLTAMFLDGKYRTTMGEILLVDEDALREGRGLLVKDRLVVETIESLEGHILQGSKDLSYSGWDEENIEEITEYLIEEILPQAEHIIIGPGSTLLRLARKLGIKKPLLGVSLLSHGNIVCVDCDSLTIYNHLVSLKDKRKVKVVLTPIGGTGFLIGRGNQQLSRGTLSLLTKDNLIVVATRGKIRALKSLYIDTGDPNLDKKFTGYLRVIVGYREEKVLPLKNGSLIQNLDNIAP